MMARLLSWDSVVDHIVSRHVVFMEWSRTIFWVPDFQKDSMKVFSLQKLSFCTGWSSSELSFRAIWNMPKFKRKVVDQWWRRWLAWAASTNPISWPGVSGVGKLGRPKGQAISCVEEQGLTCWILICLDSLDRIVENSSSKQTKLLEWSSQLDTIWLQQTSKKHLEIVFCFHRVVERARMWKRQLGLPFNHTLWVEQTNDMMKMIELLLLYKCISTDPIQWNRTEIRDS